MPSSSTAQATRDPLDCVEGEIGFVARQPGGGGPFTPHKVTIRNARPKLNEFSLDREGFTLTPQKMSCLGEKDPDVRHKKYVEEMTAFLADYFKTSWIHPMDAPSLTMRRSRTPITHGLDDTDIEGVKATAGVAHADFSPIAGPMLAAQQNQAHGIPIRSYSRLMIINTWRPVTPPPQDFPLALCDSTSVREDDVMSTLFTDPGSGRAWINGAGYYSENARWWYFPDMTPDELILFKGYDSKQDFRVIHGAFDNRAASPDAGIRESIEYRFFVYYE